MLTFIIWSLVVFGAANGVAVSGLIAPIREWLNKKSAYLGKLVNCPMCLGFWFGGLVGLYWYSPTTHFVLDCFLGSATSWLLYLLIYKRQYGS